MLHIIKKIKNKLYYFKYQKALKKKDRKFIINYYRHHGVCIGDNCNICSNVVTEEPYLISIGDNTVISYGVNFITHDASIGAVIGEKYVDLYGKIKIGSNCFIGAGTTIMYGVTLGDNTVVAAGTVVTKSFPDGNVVLGGNPCRIIKSTSELVEGVSDKLVNTSNLTFEQKKKKVLESNSLIQK